jgi:hypothetical protein
MNGNGRLEVAELHQVMRDCGMELTQQQLEKVNASIQLSRVKAAQYYMHQSSI